MTLRDRIKEDLDNAKKNNVKDAELILGVIYSQILNKEKTLGRRLLDDETQAILSDNISSQRRALSLNREDMSAYWGERFLDSYLPNGLSRNELRAKVGTYIGENPKVSLEETFEALKKKLSGKCDEKKLKECVKEAFELR